MVEVVTVTVPHTAPPAHAPVGPEIDVPAAVEYEIDDSAPWPPLEMLHVYEAAAGAVLLEAVQPLNASAGCVNPTPETER